MNLGDRLFDGDGEPVGGCPVYFCEICGKQIDYPCESGKCWPCEVNTDESIEEGN